MPKSKSQMRRLLEINRLLNQKKYVTRAQLADYLEVSEDSIKQDIDYLRVVFNAPIGYSRNPKGHYYTTPFNIATDFGISLEEFQRLSLAMQTLNQFRQLEVFKDIQSTFDRLEQSIRFKFNKKATNYIYFEHIPYYKGTENIPSLMEAIEHHAEIIFYYQSYNNETPLQHTFHPYVLKEHTNRWYVIGLLTQLQSITVFALDRITSDTIHKTGHFFKPEEKFDTLSYFKNTVGMAVHNDQPVQNIILQFSAQQAKYFKSKPFHLYEVVSENENGLIVQMSLIPNYELKRIIAGMGNGVVVCAPESFKQEVKIYLKSAADQYV